MRGKVKGLSGNHIWIETNSTIILPIDTEVDIEEHKEGRSLSANAYFHKLVDKLRQKLRISFAACKNQLITSYGQMEYVDGEPLTYGTKAPPEYMRERSEVHMRLFRAEPDGWNWYVVYRGTHTYDTKEMSILIDGTVEECKEQGIETMTPNELERLKGYERYRK